MTTKRSLAAKDFPLSEIFLEVAVRKVHWNFLAKHIKNISLTVLAKALVDYATFLR